METILATLFFCTLIAAAVFVLFKTVLPSIRTAALHKQLMRSGIEADATILTVNQTGLYVNSMPQLRLEVQVHPAVGRSFIAESRQVLDFVQIPNFQSGRRLRVKYNPACPKQVVLVGLVTSAPATSSMSVVSDVGA